MFAEVNTKFARALKIQKFYVILRVMIYEYDNYRTFLKSLVSEKQAKNPQFSMRRMAQNLGLAPSTFSEVLKGKKNLSHQMAMNIAFKLGLKNKEADYFCLLVNRDAAHSPEVKERLQKKLENIHPERRTHNFDVDLFRLIADWQNLAILSSLNLKTSNYKVDGIAKILGIDKILAQKSLDLLERLGLIEKQSDHSYIRKTSNLMIEAKLSTESLHQYHRQMLQKASEALEGQAFHERIIRTENIVIDENQIEQASQYIEEFVENMTKLSKQAKLKNRLYHLGTQFFKLNK